MKYTICETLTWHVMTPPLFRWLKEQEPKWDIAELKKKAKRIYIEMVERTPDIGSHRKNSLRICLSGGMMWLSVFEAADGKINEKYFAEMVEASMNSPLIKGSFKGKSNVFFTSKGQRKYADHMTKANQLSDSPFNWNAEVTLGGDADEFTVKYHRCGLCALGRQEGLFHLVPYMCTLDIKFAEWMGGVLYRTKTLASGGDCCDFYICRKDSKWDQERQNNEQKQ